MIFNDSQKNRGHHTYYIQITLKNITGCSMILEDTQGHHAYYIQIALKKLLAIRLLFSPIFSSSSGKQNRIQEHLHGGIWSLWLGGPHARYHLLFLLNVASKLLIKRSSIKLTMAASRSLQTYSFQISTSILQNEHTTNLFFFQGKIVEVGFELRSQS